jgi:hypothetical protein
MRSDVLCRGGVIIQVDPLNRPVTNVLTKYGSLQHYSGSSLGSAVTNVATGKAVLLLQHCLY